MIQLSEKHVMVIGGSRGIGAAITKMAALDAGARVTLTYTRGRAPAEGVANAIQAGGGTVRVQQCEMAEAASVRNALEESTAAFGMPSGLVVSASVVNFESMLELREEVWDAVCATNLRGTFLVLREYAELIRRNGDGEKADRSVVILTSTSGQDGGKGGSVYSVTKAGQIRMMKGFATELAPRGIRVNCVAPAWTETDMAAEKLTELGRERVVRDFPLGRIGLPEDVAGPVCFLLSPLARFMTGSTVTVDGGLGMKG